jgi:anthranilate/para-aminobenzoate synthase component II
MELEAARMAIEKDLPIFAICRGIQVLNVSIGGTVYQDIGSEVQESINHTQKADKSVNTHIPSELKEKRTFTDSLESLFLASSGTLKGPRKRTLIQENSFEPLSGQPSPA